MGFYHTSKNKDLSSLRDKKLWKKQWYKKVWRGS